MTAQQSGRWPGKWMRERGIGKVVSDIRTPLGGSSPIHAMAINPMDV